MQREINYRRLAGTALLSFVILGFWGLVLRYMHLFPLKGVNYMFLLHAHSHFAFAGWMYLGLALLIARSVGAKARSWNAMFATSIVSAFGMLISFSLQGYKAVPIVFSTLFIVVNFWFARLYFKERQGRGLLSDGSAKLIRASIFFLCLSAAGPLLLGPLMVTGMKHSPLYQDAIYFYLHFQMNGWMLLAALGLFCKRYLSQIAPQKQLMWWLQVFMWSNIPLFFIFTLWSAPPHWLWVVATAGGIANLISWFVLAGSVNIRAKDLPFLVKAALLAISLKVLFQATICIPDIGNWAFSNRNLVIGYIHLLTLACIMPLILNEFIQQGFIKYGKASSVLNTAFIASVVIYLVLLFFQPLLGVFGIFISHYEACLFIVSLALVGVGIGYYSKVKS